MKKNPTVMYVALATDKHPALDAGEVICMDTNKRECQENANFSGSKSYKIVKFVRTK